MTTCHFNKNAISNNSNYTESLLDREFDRTNSTSNFAEYGTAPSLSMTFSNTHLFDKSNMSDHEKALASARNSLNTRKPSKRKQLITKTHKKRLQEVNRKASLL